MRRWFLTIPAFLLLGAVVNVAVAWAIAIWSGPMLLKTTPFAGPTIGNLGPGSNVTIPGQGFTINADTPSWCCTTEK